MLVVYLKKTNYDTKISELEKKLTDHNLDKYLTTPEFSTLAASVFNARLAQANLITKIDFDAKLSSRNRKINANKSKYLLAENELEKLKTFDSSYFIGKSHFAEYGNGNYIYYWQSKGLSDEKINSIKKSNHSITPNLNYHGTKARLEFNGSCFKQDKGAFNHGKVGNIYFVYEISKNIDISNYPKLENFLFGAVTLTKNADINKYKYFEYGIGFD